MALGLSTPSGSLTRDAAPRLPESLCARGLLAEGRHEDVLRYPPGSLSPPGEHRAGSAQISTLPRTTRVWALLTRLGRSVTGHTLRQPKSTRRRELLMLLRLRRPEHR